MSEETEKMICGLVMPISKTDGCEPTHWAEVRDILDEAIEEAGFLSNLVSDADEVGIIQKRIIQNLYENPIVVCDVSGKNPNVMFELGLRLAFDKPAIIVKDDQTTYTFDTAPIEHLTYPRDLRFSQIVEFKERLAEKIQATHKKSIDDPSFTTFLKHFGEFTVAKINKRELPGQEYIVEQLQIISANLQRLQSKAEIPAPYASKFAQGDLNICLNQLAEEKINEIAEIVRLASGVKHVEIERRSANHKHLIVDIETPTEPEIRRIADIVVRANKGAKNFRGMQGGRLVPIARLKRAHA